MCSAWQATVLALNILLPSSEVSHGLQPLQNEGGGGGRGGARMELNIGKNHG